MKKSFNFLIVATLTLLLIFSSSVVAANAQTTEDVLIGVLLSDSRNQTLAYMAANMEDEGKKLGVDVTVNFYGGNVATLIDQIENFVSAGAKGLIIMPAALDMQIDEIRAAHDAGIVITNYDIQLADDVIDYYFIASNHELGYTIGSMAAKWANENLVAKGKEVIVGVGNYPILDFMLERENGFRAALADLCPEAKIVIEGQCGTVETGMQVGENFLQAYPNMNLVCGINDNSVQGIYEAFSAEGLADRSDIGLFSCDGTSESLYAISKGGIYRGTVDLDLNGVGRRMVDATVGKILKTEGWDSIPKENFYPMNPITIENVQDYEESYAQYIK